MQFYAHKNMYFIYSEQLNVIMKGKLASLVLSYIVQVLNKCSTVFASCKVSLQNLGVTISFF